MTTKRVFEAKRSGSGRKIFIKDLTYEINPIYKRRLIAQPCELRISSETSYTESVSPGASHPGVSTASSDPTGPYALNIPSSVTTAVYNRAYGKFVRKLRDSNSSLGVTFASFLQTRDMLQQKLKLLASVGDRLVSTKKVHELKKSDFLQLSLTREGSKRALKHVADNHLEFIFGWVPLYDEVVATTKTLTDLTIPPVWVNARAGGSFTSSFEEVGVDGISTVSCYGRHSVTLGALIQVSNPNLYLANRLGFANIPGVAWDLVPWSFVVNMFVNANAVISSLTDFAGLTYSQSSATYTYKGASDFAYRSLPGKPRATARGVAFHKKRRREVGMAIPKPSLVFRLPDLSSGTLAMASSLAAQRFIKLGGLLR